MDFDMKLDMCERGELIVVCVHTIGEIYYTRVVRPWWKTMFSIL